MESAEQPDQDVHDKLRKPLEELGHRVSTISSQDSLPLSGAAKEWIEEQTHDAVHFAETAVNSDELAKIRFARENEPTNIFKKRFNQVKNVLKKAA